MAHGMWGLSCYFNPCGWASRRRNFEIFWRSLSLPLVVVEWSTTENFELQDSDDLRVVRISGGSTLWQKERLLNLGIQALPDTCNYVAILDADLIFENSDWPEQAIDALTRDSIIQPFSEVCHLPPSIQSETFLHASEEPAYTSRCESLGHALYMAADRDAYLDQLISNQSQRFKALLQHDDSRDSSRLTEDINAFSRFGISTPGLAWCCSRDSLNSIGAIPDRFIGGGGDLFLMLGLLGRGEQLLKACSSAGLSYVDHHAYRQFCLTAQPHTLGALSQRVFHLHHGSLSSRRYDGRHADLQLLNLDLDTDIGINNTGLLCYMNSRGEALAQHMQRYFLGRMDDEGMLVRDDL